jgi:hypothetical protein
MRSFALALCASTTLVLSGCGGGGGGSDDSSDGGNSGGETTPTWTVMVYGHADHNLTPNMLADLQEMVAVQTNDNFKIVLQLDLNDQTIADYGLADEIPGGVHRGIIANADFQTQLSLGEQNLDDPAQLTDFITWTATNHPADRYGLVMWDHGGQWIGFGGDTTNGTADAGIMQIKPMATAIKASLQANNISSLEFLAFDTCLMGGAEVLSDFTDITDILIANPEIDYGDGWDYNASLNWLASNPNSTGREFAVQEATTWSDHHLSASSDSNDKAFAMHVVYDLSHYSSFEQQLLSFSQNLVIAGEQESYADVRRNVTQYSINDIKSAGEPTNFIDIGEFASSVKSNTTNTDLQSSADSLINSIDDLTVTVVAGSRKQDASGLSIWYPLNGSSSNAEFSDYQQLTLSQTAESGWDEFLTSIQTAYQGDQGQPVLTQETAGADTANASAPFSFNVNIPETDIASIESIVIDHVDPNNPGTYYILGQAEIFAPGAGPGVYSVDWDTSLPTISDGINTAFLGGFQESPDSPFLISYAMYSHPNSAEDSLVILITEVINNALVVVGALDGETDDGVAPRSVELVVGGSLTPVHLSYTATDPSDQSTWSELSIVTADDSTMTIPTGGIGDLTVGFNQLVDGSYLMLTQAEDDYGNESVVLANVVNVAE